jgi:hypothetical protein
VPARPPDDARARPRARSGPRPRHGSRRIALALPAVALCGLVIGLIDWSPAPAREAADRAPTAGERVQRLEHQRAVNDAVNDLAARRTAIRHRLRRAVRPAGQAAAANALADAYGVARETLDGSGAALRRDSPIRTSLRDAERSYQRLARAAQKRDRRQWRDARRQTRRHEAYLERALG